MPFVALLDADILYPPTLRDVLLSLSEAGIYQIRWSPDILDEVERNVAKRGRAPSAEAVASGANYLRRTMEMAFPEAMVERSAYAALIEAMTNDFKDRHVLAAAVAGRADVIVTSNVKDFPEQSTLPLGIEVQKPDTFLIHQFGLAPSRIANVLTRLAGNRHSPLDTPEGILKRLEYITPEFTAVALAWLTTPANNSGSKGKPASMSE